MKSAFWSFISASGILRTGFILFLLPILATDPLRSIVSKRRSRLDDCQGGDSTSDLTADYSISHIILGREVGLLISHLHAHRDISGSSLDKK